VRPIFVVTRGQINLLFLLFLQEFYFKNIGIGPLQQTESDFVVVFTERFHHLCHVKQSNDRQQAIVKGN